jgi:hypothetical protein
MKPLSVVAVVISMLCQSLQEAAGQRPIFSDAKNASSASFLDSIAKKYKLSHRQISAFTSVDSIWYTGENSAAGFAGDKVFHFARGFIGAIIDYDDKRNCIYKYLLLFNATDRKNTAYMKVYSDCDRDKSSSYTTLRYRLLNDSVFETTKAFTPANSDKVQSVKKYKWKISNSGRFEPVQ